MGLVDWSNVDKSGGNKGGFADMYLKLKPGGKYKIRPVHKPIEVWRYYVSASGKTHSAVTADPDKCIIRQKYPNEKPKLRYAINVIDRADKKIKILEAPVTIFRAMRQWAENTEKSPGGPDGCDFSIEVDLKGNDPRNTKYACVPLTQTPFSEVEMAQIKNERHDLEKIYTPTPQDKIESILFPKDETGDNGQAPVVAGKSSKEEDFAW